MLVFPMLDVRRIFDKGKGFLKDFLLALIYDFGQI